jgi:long-chain acyl-CoA synthetase
MKLKDDMALAKPTIFASVPRLFLRFFQLIKAKAESLTGIKKKIFDRGYAAKLHYLKNGGHVTHKFYDRLVFNTTKEAFGGRVRYLITASAPISGEIIDFLKIVTCCPMMEGYGQTESTGGSFLTDPWDSEVGHVGGPLPQNEFKVIDVPEMKYSSTDKDANGVLVPRGEICYRGSSIFQGYYRDLAKTREAVDEDGWLHSGDIGMILPNGGLKLFDRRKNIFKLSQGEYIAPEKVENIYMKVAGVAEVFVHGEALHAYCIAIVVPTPHGV